MKWYSLQVVLQTVGIHPNMDLMAEVTSIKLNSNMSFDTRMQFKAEATIPDEKRGVTTSDMQIPLKHPYIGGLFLECIYSQKVSSPEIKTAKVKRLISIG